MEKHIYKPLPHFLEIRKSNIHGSGLFANDKNTIPKDIFLGVSHISVSALYGIPEEPDFRAVFDTNNMSVIANDRIHHHEDMTKKNLFLNGFIRTPLGGFINHSEDSNLEFIYLDYGLFGIKTTKEVLAGEELTLNYQYAPCGVIKP